MSADITPSSLIHRKLRMVSSTAVSVLRSQDTSSRTPASSGFMPSTTHGRPAISSLNDSSSRAMRRIAVHAIQWARSGGASYHPKRSRGVGCGVGVGVGDGGGVGVGVGSSLAASSVVNAAVSTTIASSIQTGRVINLQNPPPSQFTQQSLVEAQGQWILAQGYYKGVAAEWRLVAFRGSDSHAFAGMTVGAGVGMAMGAGGGGRGNDGGGGGMAMGAGGWGVTEFRRGRCGGRIGGLGGVASLGRRLGCGDRGSGRFGGGLGLRGVADPVGVPGCAS